VAAGAPVAAPSLTVLGSVTAGLLVLQREASAGTLRVMSYNVKGGPNSWGPHSGHWQNDTQYRKSIGDITYNTYNQAPEVVGLQEICSWEVTDLRNYLVGRGRLMHTISPRTHDPPAQSGERLHDWKQDRPYLLVSKHLRNARRQRKPVGLVGDPVLSPVPATELAAAEPANDASKRRSLTSAGRSAENGGPYG
jgi:hypothetical protein